MPQTHPADSQQSPLAAAQIQRDSAAPLYAQIQRDIEVSIATNKLCPGDAIPGELELADRYGVSRVTVRQALRDLVTEGLLYRVQGKGTFVSESVIQRTKPNITSFFYEMLESGRRPSARVWSEVCQPDPETVRRLGLDPDERVVVTRRLRYVDGEPIVYQVNTTRHRFCPDLVSEDLSNQSFQYTLEVKYNLRYTEVEESLTATTPSAEVAQHLGIPRAVPVLVDERIIYGVGGVIIDSMRAYLRGDRYAFKVTRNLSAADC